MAFSTKQDEADRMRQPNATDFFFPIGWKKNQICPDFERKVLKSYCSLAPHSSLLSWKMGSEGFNSVSKPGILVWPKGMVRGLRPFLEPCLWSPPTNLDPHLDEFKCGCCRTLFFLTKFFVMLFQEADSSWSPSPPSRTGTNWLYRTKHGLQPILKTVFLKVTGRDKLLSMFSSPSTELVAPYRGVAKSCFKRK